MKESIKKIFAILVLFLLIFNSSLLTVVSTAVDEVKKLIDVSKISSVIDVNLEKYVNFNISDEDKGTLVELNIKTGIEYKDDQQYVPIKATRTVTNLPQINGKYPESVDILAKSTKATNGDENGKDVYNKYDQEKGTLEILADNKENDNGDIYTENVNGARDEFVVIARYGADCYSDKNEKRDLSVTGTVEEILANEDANKLSNNYELNFEVTENVSGLISTDITTSDIYNGYINSNKQNGTKNATEYTENMKINVSYKDIANEVTIETDNKFINVKNEEIETDEILYKGLKLNKQNVLDILGEEGKLQVLNKDGEVLGEINKDTEATEDGTIEINYENEQKEIVIKLTKPAKLGTVNIENKKVIKETMTDLNNNKIAAKNIIKCVNYIQEKDKDTQEVVREYTEEKYKFENTKEIEIKQSSTRVDVDFDKTEWTNNVQNDVTITATLVTNGPEYNLFKNPVLEIKMPAEVEKVVLGDVSLLYDDNLIVKSADVVEKDGVKVIRIVLNGVQDKYSVNSLVSGANVIIPATVIVKKDIASTDSAVGVVYANESGVVNDYERDGLASKSVNVKIDSQNENEVVKEQNNEQTQNPIEENLDMDIVATVGNETLKDGDVVHEGEIITYTYKITNNTNKTFYNVKAVANVPDGTVYVTKNENYDPKANYQDQELFIENKDVNEITKNIENLEVNKSYEYSFFVKVLNVGNVNKKEIFNNLQIYRGKEEITKKSIKLIASNAKLRVEVEPAYSEISTHTDNMLVYPVNVINLDENNLSDIFVEMKLSKEYEFYFISQTGFECDYDKNTKILKVKIDSITAKENKKLYIRIGIDNFEDGKFEYDIPFMATAYADDNIIYRSNVDIQKAYSAGIQIVQTSETEGEDLYSDQLVKYNIKIKNIGKRQDVIDIINNIPKGLSFAKITYECYEINKETEQFEKVTKTEQISLNNEKNDFDVETFIYPGEVLNMSIIAQVDRLDTFLEIENIVTVTGEKIDTKVSNAIKNRIVPYGYVKPDPKPDPDPIPDPDPKPDPDPTPDPDPNPDENKTYTIEGVAWVDSNKNAQRDSDEKLLEGITVKLFNADTNSIVTDKDNNALKTITSSAGEYSFNNVKKGRYLVLFEYDTDKYNLTSYKKLGISDNLNSDAILKEVNIDGNVKNVAITDVLEVNNTNITNIDIGLIEKGILDLSLEKYITKITVENNGKTNEYSYNNSKLAKVEIPAKQLSNSTLKVEYKLIIKNNGNVDAYATEILDEIPEELSFDNSLNLDWTNKNEKAVNKKFAATKIEPGESKELTIILTKDLDEGSIGTITNNAKISDYYSSYEVRDDNNENESSQAQLIISIKTGNTFKIFVFVIIMIIFICLVLIVKNKKRLLSISIIILTLFIVVSYSPNIYAGHDGVIGDFDYLLYGGDLAGHVNKTNNWEKLKTSFNGFWCISPGKHLGKEGEFSDHTIGEIEYGSCTGGGHAYKKVEGSENTYDNYSNFYKKMNGTKNYGTGVFNGIFSKNIDGSASVTSISSPEKNKFETSGNRLLIGPFVYSYNLQNANIQNESFSVKDGTTEVPFEICNKNDSSFYILVPNYVSDLKITMNSTVNVHSKSTVINTVDYEFRGITQGTTCRTKVNGSWKTIGYARGTSYRTDYDAQTLVKITVVPKEKWEPREISCGWEWQVERSNIIVNKKDEDTNSPLIATMKIVGPAEYVTTAQTQNNGSWTFSNLLPGNYTVIEEGAPVNYNLVLQTNTVQSIYIGPGESKTVNMTNKQYGDLWVTKRDTDTNQTQLGGNVLQNIQFKIYVIKNGQKYYLNGNANSSDTTHYNYSDFNVIEQYKDGAKTFITNSNAQFAIQNLPVYEGVKPIEYYIEEYALPANLAEYYEVKKEPDRVTLLNGNTVYKDVLNKQIYLQISGYVWEDIADKNKNTTRNDLYENTDKLANGVTVRLKHINKTDLNMNTVTDKNGAYRFKKVRISELSNYYIEFEYNGLRYECVAKNLNVANGSKAVEIGQNRVNFNNSYANITGGNEKGNTTVGYSRNANGTVTNNLTYKNGTYSSSLVQNTQYATSSANGYVSSQNGSAGVVMTSDTRTAAYSLNMWSPGVIELPNINLGLYEREQPDMAIATDLNNIDLKINGYSHNYMYNQRIKSSGIDIFSETQKWNKTEQQKKDEEGTYPRSYTRTIYNNYVYSSGITGDGKLEDSNKLEVYLTYKIVVKNESSSLYMSANEIANYYDKTLDYVSSYYEDNKGNKVDITWTSGKDKNGYGQLRTTGLKDVKIEHGKSVIIYLKMKKNTVLQWADKNEISESANNVTEITSYSSYTKNGNNYLYYSGIDKDSAPDNIKLGTINTYEDDTDSAPVITIKFDEPRTISGYVFEDYTDSELNTNAERKGDGKYDASKDGYVGNVKVELIKISDNKAEEDKVAYIYPKAVSSSNLNAEKAEYTTTDDGKGYYEFIGVIPGKYYIKYTYGDGSVIYKKTGEKVDVTTQDYKSTILTSETIKKAYGDTKFDVSSNPRWYQSSSIKGYSSAVDDYATRKSINQALSTITYGVKSQYERAGGEFDNYKIMTARTPDMNVAIENEDGESTEKDQKRTRLYDNINFGIVERPRKSIELTKEINYIKLTLANGQVLVEGDPRKDEIRYLIYPQGGSLKIEVDSEIIEGATLEVTYGINILNKSEIDYDTESYYKYGYKDGKPVTMTINSVIDYMDEDLTTAYTYDGDGEWKLINPKDLYKESDGIETKESLISKSVYSDIKTNHNVIVNNCNLELGTDESNNSKSISIKASKLLSNSKEMSYSNYAEVITASNSVGRFYGQKDEGSSNKWKNTTPGNFNPSEPSDSEEDNNRGNRSKLNIIPPTGDNMDKYVVYGITGISCLIVLAVGIILIKKKVLHK